MIDKKKAFVFGPIPSRRLGLSLGVDVVPLKKCSFDCIYCQLGKTAEPTLTRGRYVPITEVMEQLKQKLSEHPHLDYITFSGSGEPTLNSDIGEIILSIKRHTSIPVAVLTNGSLLWDKQVQEALKEADLVIPSLDAGSADVFRRINRPHPGLDFEKIVRGLAEFRRVYDGQIWLEIFLLEGVNTTASEILEIKKHVDIIRPDRIQLNSVARPPAEDFARKVSHEDMIRIQSLFGERAEIIAPYEKAPGTARGRATTDDVLATLQRRACTAEDIASGLAIHINEAIKHLAQLEEQGLLQKIRKDTKLYYQVIEEEG
jgi:wyosine [tRNA(Phe)-imidazoG37] synthetase (radical SAM superfamily)